MDRPLPPLAAPLAQEPPSSALPTRPTPRGGPGQPPQQPGPPPQISHLGNQLLTRHSRAGPAAPCPLPAHRAGFCATTWAVPAVNRPRTADRRANLPVGWLARLTETLVQRRTQRSPKPAAIEDAYVFQPPVGFGLQLYPAQKRRLEESASPARLGAARQALNRAIRSRHAKTKSTLDKKGHAKI